MQTNRDRYSRALSRETSLSARIAEQVLTHYESPLLRLPRPIPVEGLAAQWGIEQALKLHDKSSFGSMGSAGITRRLALLHEDLSNEQQSNEKMILGLEKSQYEMRIFGVGYRRRFTIAHELAHVVLHTKFTNEHRELGVDARERVADAAAGMILLPDSVIAVTFSGKTPLVVGIPLLEATADKLKVSLSLLVKRLGDATRSGLIKSENGAFIVDLARSRKAGQNMAPRVRIWFLPLGWFLPSNKRLTSLGLQYLPSLFYSAGLYEEQGTEDDLTLWRKDRREWYSMHVKFSFKCYMAEGNARKMLTVIEPPFPEVA